MLLKDESWDVEDFKDVKFSGKMINIGKMYGLSFKSDILNYHASVKGLELTI